jgi:hypothetical protein
MMVVHQSHQTYLVGTFVVVAALAFVVEDMLNNETYYDYSDKM